MNLIPRKTNRSDSVFQPLADLHHEIDRLFDLSFPQFPAAESAWVSSWSPSLDVYDEKEHYLVHADLPGLNREDITVSLEDNRLTIQGEKKQRTENKDKQCLRTERFYGRFQRSIVLPVGIDAGKVKASFKDGVLELTLPKRDEYKPKQVNIEVK